MALPAVVNCDYSYKCSRPPPVVTGLLNCGASSHRYTYIYMIMCAVHLMLIIIMVLVCKVLYSRNLLQEEVFLNDSILFLECNSK